MDEAAPFRGVIQIAINPATASKPQLHIPTNPSPNLQQPLNNRVIIFQPIIWLHHTFIQQTNEFKDVSL